MRDQDPYVRKTAAVCVAKLFMQDRHLVENAGFIDLLREMLVDSNPSVGGVSLPIMDSSALLHVPFFLFSNR
jgi:vesicle coat complex subunit